MKRLLIAAGGTGGHVYPALAVAHLAKDEGWDILWLGTRGRMEEKIVPNFFPIEFINMQAVRNKGWRQQVSVPWRLTRAIAQSRSIIKHFRPDCLLTMGGFVCAPAGLAARCSRVPFVVHEQNAVAGLTNKLLKPMATSVLEAFSGTFAASDKVRFVGNPVRHTLCDLPPTKARLQARTGVPHLLVLGGSQGAHALNSVLIEAIACMPEAVRPAVWHQTGEHDFNQINVASEQFKGRYKAQAFIHDMAKAYQWADLVICRSGALTVSELAMVGLASILVPFPSAVDNHQHLNAQQLVKCESAWLMPQARLTSVSLGALLEKAFSDRDQLVVMGERARAVAPLQATQLVLSECEYVRQK